MPSGPRAKCPPHFPVENQAYDEQDVPPILDGGPSPRQFLAALHAGCQDNDGVTEPDADPVVELWRRARLDPAAAEFLDRLDDVRRTHSG